MFPNPQHPSVMRHSFSNIPQAQIQRSNFKRSHSYKTTFDAGYLIPIYVDEALPGDTFNLNLNHLARLSTPITPIMDNLRIDFFFFAVPIRLIWDNFQKFMGEQIDPGDSTDYTVPTVDADGVTGFTELSLSDYFGLPTGVASLTVNSLHHRAYNLIWNEWFRDQNLQDSVVVDKDDGPDTITDYVLLKRGKRHDYFTSCLPWPQKGDQIDLPLGSVAPVLGIGKIDQTFDQGPGNVYETSGSGTTSYTSANLIDNGNVDEQFWVEEDPDNAGYPGIFADLSNATAATINSLREAFQLQRMLERDARGGTRYTEIIKSHFLVDSPDGRLQRPEYLGGGSRPIIIQPVSSNTPIVAAKPIGHLAACGYSQGSGIGFTKSFVEHNVLIGLACVTADLTYQQGLNRMFSRQTRYDYYFPALAHLGEQEVLNKEIYCDGSANDDDVFGYQERWAEYRYFPSKITGRLRSNAATPLDVWHLSQEFGALPVLNSSFIEENPPLDRIQAVGTEPHIVFDGYFNLTATRPMPTYSVPGLIDHF